MSSPSLSLRLPPRPSTRRLRKLSTSAGRSSCDPGGTLRLKNFSGRVTITATDRPEVVIDAVRRAPRGRLERIRLDIHTEGPNVVVIDANRRDSSWFEFIGGNNVVETDFDIEVPRRTNLDVAVFSSAVTID